MFAEDLVPHKMSARLKSSNDRFKKKLRDAPAPKTKAVRRPSVNVLYRAPRTYSRAAPLVDCGPLGFPRMLKMRHKYVDQEAITSIATVQGTYKFSCNSLFDPNVSAAGHSALYFKQVGALYDHYTVIQSKIKVSAIPYGTGNIASQLTLVIDDDTAQAYPVPYQVLEQTDAVGKTIAGGATTPTYLSRSWNAQDFFGPSPLDQDSLHGTLTTSPAEQSYYILNFVGLTTGTAQVYITVEIEYTAIWTELKDIAPST